MSWKHLLKTKQIESHGTSRNELDELRVLVERNLQDASVEALSFDSRFVLAYNASLLLAKMVIACSGYRTRGHGAHRTTFDALDAAFGPEILPLATYLSDCRRKRNQLTYTSSGIVSETDVANLVKEAFSFRTKVEDWIIEHYPQFSLK